MSRDDVITLVWAHLKGRNVSRDGLVKLGWVHCLQYTVNCFQYNVCDLCQYVSSTIVILKIFGFDHHSFAGFPFKLGVSSPHSILRWFLAVCQMLRISC